MRKYLLLLFLALFSFSAIHAEVDWSLSADGTLTISGTDMPNYEYGSAPWYSQRESIKKIVIENEVTSIGRYAFCDCGSLTSMSIPNSVTSIGRSAFNACSSLSSITLPNSVTSIGENTFYYCKSLTSVTIPDGVTSIGDGAFYCCKALTSVSIPNSVTSIGEGAFTGCAGLTSITCEATTPPGGGPGFFYDIDKSIPVYVPANSVEAYKKTDEWKDFTNIQAIPNTYTFIDGYVYTNYELPVYDLNGRKVNENNLKSGIYVRNGKAYVVK